MNLDVKFLESNKLINEALLALANTLGLNRRDSKNMTITNFLTILRRRHANEQVNFLQKVIGESSTRLHSSRIARMPLSRMARKLNIERVPTRVVFTIDSIEKIQFLVSETFARNWKHRMEKELRQLMRLGASLGEFGLQLQFVFVSGVHLDLGIPSFLMNPISGENLENKVDYIECIYRNTFWNLYWSIQYNTLQ